MNRLGRIAFTAVVFVGISSHVFGADTPKVEPRVYKKTPQAELEMLIHFPANWKATDKRPAIVFFFGGAWRSGTVTQFEYQANYLAGRGMVAARADYRVKSRHGVSPDQCVEDAKSAVRYLRKNAPELGIDPDRIVASGGSAGGHLAACTWATPGLEAKDEDASVSSKPNLLILYNPVLNLTSDSMRERFNLSEPVAKQISPNLHLAKNTPPAIIYFGTGDRLISNGEECIARSKAIGNSAVMYTAEGVGHGFFNRSPWLERTTYLTDRFLTQHGYLEGKPPIELPEGKLAMEKAGEADAE